MQLSLKQTAELFNVSENTVIGWVNDENLPAEVVADQYRFHRAELLEWSAINHHEFSTAIYSSFNGDLTPAATHLADALEVGGILYDVDGSDLREVLENALDGLPIPPSFNTETLVELFLAREQLGSTAVGNGIAVPHPRSPILLTVTTAVARLCFLKRPLEISTPDGKPVDKLFLLICATAHDHLQLLARLGAVLRVDSVMSLLNDKVDAPQLLQAIRDAGTKFHEDENNPAAPTEEG